MSFLGEQLDSVSTLNQVTVPDLWQQEAVNALREGKDVVVHAPTGAGKTLIFELWSNAGKNHGQAIYTVPTRALANDKMAEWRAQNWNVGIATGDLAENLDAPVLVATLETQKNRLIRGDGPALLVVDEYQMLGDPDRGLNYELALALAPPQTQLLLLSGSVANPGHVVKWLERLGRRAVLIRHDERPVPLDEVFAARIHHSLPREITGYWPRFTAKALAEDLGPILIFSPQRRSAEKLAQDLARKLPNPNPLQLSQLQKQLVGSQLAKLLKCRIAYHHSGLSYAARAGVVEPLAKAGQLRVVVATMGLAAGINFSLRSVALAGDSYRRDFMEQPLRPDEILQMFGRAGRRGIDEQGYVLISANQIRIHDGYPGQLARSAMVDWAALLGLMDAATNLGEDPYTQAVQIQERLFTTKTIVLGVEESLKNPVTPCGLKTDAERARHVRRKVTQMLNSHGEWETKPNAVERPLSEVHVMEPIPADILNLLKLRSGLSRPDNHETSRPEDSAWRPRLLPILSQPRALSKTGPGTLIPLQESADGNVYGKTVVVADKVKKDRVLLVKWIRKLLKWKGRYVTGERWEKKIVPLLRRKFKERNTEIIRFEENKDRIMAVISLAAMSTGALVDAYGVALWRPVTRQILQPDCAHCALTEVCRGLSTKPGVAMLWRRLELVHPDGVPTRRGRIVSFFSQGNGLAIAAALEDETYPLADLIYDLANLDAGYRFCGEDNRWAGRLAEACHKIFEYQTIPGYLENGVPPRYGAGAEQVVESLHKQALTKHDWITEQLGDGDIDRVIIEWRSLLRQIAHAPELDWPHWTEFQQLAKATLNETQSPTLSELPPLEYHQTKRITHRLHFKGYR